QASVLDGGFAYFEASGRKLYPALETPVGNLDASYAGRHGCRHRTLADHDQRAIVDQDLQVVRRHAGQRHDDGEFALGFEYVGGWLPGRAAGPRLAEPEELPMQPVCLLQHAQGVDPYRIGRL